MILVPVNFSAPDAPSAFSQSLTETGCAVVVGSPVPPELVQSVYDEWLSFFETGAKHRYTADGTRPDGYFPPPARPAADVPGRDRKEFFHVYPGGCYPAELSPGALRYLAAARALARTLLQWIDGAGPAHTGPLPALAAQAMDDSDATVLRIQRYLPGDDGDSVDVPRALAHTDVNLLTLMPAPSEPGLQIRLPDGWADVLAPAGSMIVQAGEMLELATRGRCPAVLHRVMHKGGRVARTSRMSLPLFVHPTDETELAEGISAAAFRSRRLIEISARGWNIVAGGARR